MADNAWANMDATLRKMRELPVKLQKKGLRAALRKGAVIVRDAARNNARRVDDPQTRENIPKNITIQSSRRMPKGDVGLRVGVMGGSKSYANTKDNVRGRRAGKSFATGGNSSNPGGDTFYWRFVELGTSKIRAQPFMVPALSNNVGKVIATVTSELSDQITKLARLP